MVSTEELNDGRCVWGVFGGCARCRTYISLKGDFAFKVFRISVNPFITYQREPRLATSHMHAIVKAWDLRNPWNWLLDSFLWNVSACRTIIQFLWLIVFNGKLANWHVGNHKLHIVAAVGWIDAGTGLSVNSKAGNLPCKSVHISLGCYANML